MMNDFKIVDGELIEYRGTMSTVVVPEGVTSIGYKAFYDYDNLIGIELPEGITSIEPEAFRSCSNLANIEIPEGVTSIGNSAFADCGSLTSITIPNGVTTIEDYAFRYCDSLTNIKIPDSVTNIGSSIFYDCDKLIIYCETVLRPSGWSRFWSTDAAAVIWDCKNNNKDEKGYAYYFDNGVVYKLKDGKATVSDASKNISGEYIILDSIAYKNTVYSVTSIGSRAFYYCRSLTSIEMPDSITSIGYKAFYFCDSLTSIEIPEGVTSIGSWAFAYCNSLENVVFPGTIVEISNCAFRDCHGLISRKGGYKAFNKHNKTLSCREMNFTLGEVAEVDSPLILCNTGIHYCENMFDIFSYYYGVLNEGFCICECEVLGDICNKDECGNLSTDSKLCTNKIKPIRILSNQEIIDILNNK